LNESSNTERKFTWLLKTLC